MCARGAKVVLSARRTDALERVKTLCVGMSRNDQNVFLFLNEMLCYLIASPGKHAAFVLRLDLEDYASHPGAVEAVLKHFGQIDILVNNGGRSQRALVETTDLKVDQDMMALNVIGVTPASAAADAQAPSPSPRPCCRTCSSARVGTL
jgi:dehydrogenase/reductase SDR family protein 7